MKYNVTNPAHRQIVAEALLQALQESAGRNFGPDAALSYVIGRLNHKPLEDDVLDAVGAIRRNRA